MKQSRIMSLLETFLSTAIGFAVALATQFAIFPLFGFRPALSENLAITAIFTVVSIIRQFVMRRLFEALHIRRPLSPAVQAVIAERFRQIEVEGWDASHDDDHDRGEMSSAGANYAFYAGSDEPCPVTWPWDKSWWKPQNFRRDLVRACALIIAELDRFDRKKTAPSMRANKLLPALRGKA